MKTIFKMAVMALCLVPNSAFAEKLSLKQISNYLNSLKAAKGAFTQVNPDNTLSKGDFMLKRPGRMRFEYAKPNPALVVANNGTIAIFDKKVGSGPQVFPVNKTPLGIILKNNVNLTNSGMIVSHVEDGPTTKIVARDPKNPRTGKIEMVFTASPIELRQWVVTDQSGKKTTVILGELDKGVRFSQDIFDIRKITKDLGQTRER